MKKLLLLFAMTFMSITYAQNNNTLCSDAQALCGALGNPFINTINSDPAMPGPEYGCLGNEPNPYWFYIPVSDDGVLSFFLSQESFEGNPIDIDFICYGPFSSLAESCNNLDLDHIIDCSYSAAATETATIPNAQAGEYYIMMVTNFSNQAGLITIDIEEETTGAIDCTGIQLTTFIDTNENGVKDSNELNFNLGNFNYEINNDGVVHNVTTPTGNYFIYDPEAANTYDIGFDVLPLYAPYFSVTTSYYEDIAVIAGETVTTYYFPVTVVQPYSDLAVYIIPVQQPRPGFEHNVNVVYANLSPASVAEGSVTFTADAPLTITNVGETVTDLTDVSFTYNFTNLAPYETVTFPVTLYVPVETELGEVVTNTAIITSEVDDMTLDNNTSVNNDIVVGSYDPNDKMESRGRDVLISEFDNNDYLYYTIRFQNMGTASAINVRVEDVLNDQLDESTVEMIRSSHNYVMEKDGNELTWTFDNIQLPAEQDDEAGSNGYVYFRVKPLPGFALGDMIPNGAGIYFDFNEVVETNTFETHFVQATASTDTFELGNFTIYPNPANNAVTIALSNTTNIINSVKVYDLTGKLIFNSSSVVSNNLHINTSAFAKGTYFVDVITNTGIKHTKKLLVN
ncbi:T9SS type A sorting domain-containing protein [Flavobacterium arcticum]|nr:T9SS type A sorting domain-containing protein [Flavobacterium arcticum]KAF2512911.1 T9SS type A sorting domain-containing protein [Flavobacterium arcticum]